LEKVIEKDLILFKQSFVQAVPRYAVKIPGRDGWKTRKFPLHDSEIKKHLQGDLVVGCLSRWYPEFAAFDFDSVPLEKVEEIREILSLDERNSMLLSSESKDSYHLYFRPEYNEKPPTIKLLQTILKPFASSRGIEIYPQKNRAFRLPFSKGTNCLDWEEAHLQSWQEKLYWLQKKDDFDLSTVSGHQTFFEFPPAKLQAGALTPAMVKDDLIIGAGPDILRYGLQAASTRDFAQFEIVKYLWRQNLNPGDALAIIWEWIQTRHNGYSKDFIRHPQQVYREIQHQIGAYYGFMRDRFTLPDQPHKNHVGFITKPDLLSIIELAQGNLPRMRFLFNLVLFMNPRRYRIEVPVHSDKLAEWSNRYLSHLQYIEEKGVLKRSTGYYVGAKSKAISLDWKWQSDQDAVLYQGRTVDTIEKASSMLFNPAEFRSILRTYVSYQAAHYATKKLFSI
jgi:hypothetical protein